MSLFNIKINFVMGKAKELLSVNRNSFKDNEFVEMYLERIKTYIADIVICQMWKFICEKYESFVVDENYVQNANIVLLALYYKRYCNNELNLDILSANPLYSNSIYKEIKRIEGSEFVNIPLKELISNEKFLLTENSCYEVKNVIEENNIKIIVDNIGEFNMNENIIAIRLLNFNQVEYISDSIFIISRENKDNSIKTIILDYNKYESVRSYLGELMDCDDYVYSTMKRTSISSFKYKNKPKSNIIYLYTNEYEIISPFTSEIDINLFEEDIDIIIKELKENYKFNELVNYVYNNALNKELFSESNYIDFIEVAYKELIEDYINYVHKGNNNISAEKILIDNVGDTTKEKEVAIGINMNEKEADSVNN